MNKTITYGVAATDENLLQILDLQSQNLPVNISQEEAVEQGFVTVHHNFELLKRMNHPYPHIVAKADNLVVGYALVMLKSFSAEIPVLVSMFERINQLEWNRQKLRDSSYFIMGQVCIKKDYRGKGIFDGLYHEMKRRMTGHFDYVITEIASRNTRSIRAHEKVGFETLLRYNDGEDWELVIWKL